MRGEKILFFALSALQVMVRQASQTRVPALCVGAGNPPTAGINRSNTAVQAVLEQPCSTGGRTGTVQPKHLPAGRTGLSNQFLGPVAQDQPVPVGQICLTSWLSLWSDSVRPNTGRTRLFKHRSSSHVRPVNAGSALFDKSVLATLD
ncbi:hypothetical protein PCANC_17159 [Puccinia coronata f. sp. avenae]|uniref:Secreted protein n=1 Tax=Puccinia coronata f. sp. avenae TaxID=200324 RepID=A0A2N5UIY0_9BASI|nr:hypothetical protein PCANC_17159 [Puccinia coronata f. sp. avenae]